MTNQPTLIFDGDCGFCTTSANWAVKHSRTPIVAHPWQFTDVTAYGLLEPQAAEKVWMVVDGERFGGSDAIAKWLILQKRWYATIAGNIMLIPPFCALFGLAYRVVAKNRHRLPGGTPACKLPQEPSQK